MNFIRRKLQASPFLANVMTLSTGSVAAQLILLIASPFITRLFTPEEFGIYFLLITVSSIISLLITGGYEKSYSLIEDDNKAKLLLTFTVFLILAITVIFIVLVIPFRNSLSGFFNISLPSSIVILIPVFSALFAYFRIYQQWMIRERKYGRHTANNLIRSAFMSAGQILLGLAKTGSIGLVSGACAGYLIPGLFMPHSKKLHRILTNRENRNKALATAREYADFPKLYLPGSIINELSIQSPIFALKAVFNDSIVGFYSLPQKILSQPSRFIGQAVGEVYYRTASSLKHKGGDLSALTIRIFKTLFLIGIIPYTALTLWGSEIFEFIFGENWSQSGEIASYLGPWLLMVFAGSPISSVFNIQNKLLLGFRLNVILLCGRIISLLAGYFIYRSFISMIIFYSAFSFLYWCFLTGLSLRLSGASKAVVTKYSLIFIFLIMIPLIAIKLILL